MPGKRRDNGLYLNKFETKDEAIDYIKGLRRKYLYTPNQKTMSLRKLVRQAKREGVVIYLNQLSNWFKDMDVDLRVTRPRGSTKIKKSYTIDQDVEEKLQDYDNMSEVVELGLKLVMRIPTEEIIMFLPVEKDEEPINVIFKKENDNVKAIATGKLKERDKQMLTGLLKTANTKGIEHIKRFAELFSYPYYGGDIINEKTDNKDKG